MYQKCNTQATVNDAKFTACSKKITVASWSGPADAMSKKTLCTVPQAAQRLTISEKSAWRMVYSGRFEVVRIGRCVRVTEESVEGIIDEGTTPIHKDDDN